MVNKARERRCEPVWGQALHFTVLKAINTADTRVHLMIMPMLGDSARSQESVFVWNQLKLVSSQIDVQ